MVVFGEEYGVEVIFKFLYILYDFERIIKSNEGEVFMLIKIFENVIR